jgi:hypothetical protein
MTHAPFEDLLLADRPLTAPEREALDAHLATCASCAALRDGWSRAAATLEAVVVTAPRPGFQARWAARHAAEREARQARQPWRIFGVAGVGATALTGVLAIFALDALPLLFSNALQQVLRWWIWARMVGGLGEALATALPAPLTAGALVVSAGLIAGAGVTAALGSAAMIRFAFQGVRR